MTDAVGSSSDTSKTSSNDGDSRSFESPAGSRHRWRSNVGDYQLPELESPEYGKREEVGEIHGMLGDGLD